MQARSTRWLLLALLALAGACPRPGRAQGPAPYFTRYTTEQGLAHNGVTALAYDRRGFLWVGTFSGLCRFDGVQFKVFRHTADPHSLPGNYVLRGGLTTDSAGYLWVATARGLWCFDPVREQGRVVEVPERRDPRADNHLLSAISFDSTGRGWFCSSQHLYCRDPRTRRLTSYPLPHAMPGDYPDVVVDAHGRPWLYAQQAVYRFDPTARRYTYYLGQDDRHPQGRPVLNGLTRAGGRALYVLSDQGAWRYREALDRFELVAAAPFVLYAAAELRLTRAMPQLWLGSNNELLCYEPRASRLTSFHTEADDSHSYPGSVTLALLPDPRTGALWVGSVRGLARLEPQTARFGRQLLRSPDPRRLPEDVQLVLPDRADSSLHWLMSRHTGLWRWQSGRFAPVAAPLGLGNRLRGLQQDARGRLWLGLEGRTPGLLRYDPATRRWRRLGQAPGSRPPGTLNILCLDHRGRLWLGAFDDGLYWYDPATDRVRPYPLPLGAHERYATVWRMQEDARGQLWVGTAQGLFCLAADRQRVRRVPLRAGSFDIRPTDLLQSTFLLGRGHRLWLTGMGFVAEADTAGRVRRAYTVANGLRADQTFGLAEDARGHLWLATDGPLHELDPTTGRFRYYDQSNGLLATTVYQGFTRGRRGLLLLGGQGGFNYFRPAELRRWAAAPPVAFTEVLVNNRPRLLAPAQAVDLHPGETTLTVGFAALNFTQAAKNRYAYRLLGFDADWIETDARTATYTNLAPGTYRLRVRAANSDGVWNRSGQTLTVRVHPAYYQTWWFRAGLVGLLLAAGWGVYRSRLAQRRHLARVRDHIAKDLHDDMGSTLSSIRIFSEVAQGQLGDAHPQVLAMLQRISTNASTLAEAMQDIIWTIKPSPDGLADVVSRMREFGLRLTEARGIAFVMHVDEPFPALHLSLEQRRNLYLIFKESVNNAVKYAACTALTVRLGLHQRQLHLRIADNGQGFDPAAARAGNGLANLHARARDIGGQVQLTSAPGAGTTVVLTAPIS